MKVVVRHRAPSRWRDDSDALLRDLAVLFWRWRAELAVAVALVALERLMASLLGDVASVLLVGALVVGVLVERGSRERILGWVGSSRVRRAWDRAVIDAGVAESPWRGPRIA